LAKNQIHFYTMGTTILPADLLAHYGKKELTTKLAKFGQIVDGG